MRILNGEFPEGKCQYGETPQEVLKREFLEETGIEVGIKALLPFIHTNYWEYSDYSQQTFCVFSLFLCQAS
jgi:8-oxo-dGTP pyrophosphatase MutT (NUDIX family)